MECLWPEASAFTELKEGEVHIWCANLDAADRLEMLERTLSPDEVKRVNRFRFHQHRRRYIVGRGTARVLIGRYLKKNPEDIVISYSEYNKPFLPNKNIRFNLSHSQEMVLFAFCPTADIGIDLERIRDIEDAEGIAARFFAATEFARFETVPVEERNEAFFNCWTRKEAFIKAVGEGLSYPLANFDVSFLPGEQVKINTIRLSAEEADQWSLYSLAPMPGYVGALAVKSKDWQLICRQYSTL